MLISHSTFIFISRIWASTFVMPWLGVCSPSSVRQSTFQIFNFSSRMTEGIFSKLATNVPYVVDSKSNMAALASDWLTLSDLLLKNNWIDLLQINLSQMLFIRSWPNVVTFYVDPKPLSPPWPLNGWYILNFVSKRQKESTPNLAQLFLMRSQPSVVTF